MCRNVYYRHDVSCRREEEEKSILFGKTRSYIMYARIMIPILYKVYLYQYIYVYYNMFATFIIENLFFL